MLISFEGIDGCGKTTQFELFKKYLHSNNTEVVSIREPGGTDFSEKVRELLLSNDYKLNPISELMLFEAARADLVEKIIKPALKSKKLVIADRFYDSTTAYQGYGRGIEKKFIKSCNQIAIQSVIPNITFYFDISLQEAKKRTVKNKKDRIEKSNNIFFKKVIEGFKSIAKENGNRFVVLDANDSIENIHNKIIKIFEEKCI